MRRLLLVMLFGLVPSSFAESLVVKAFTGTTFTLDVPFSATVLAAKEMIESQEDIAADQRFANHRYLQNLFDWFGSN